MSQFDASFVGFVTLDIAGRPVSAIPDGGGIAFLDEIRMNPAGTATGAAMNAAKLGVASTLVACVGNDERGDFIQRACEQIGVDCSMMQRSASTGTSSTILPIRPNGDRPCLHAKGAADDLFIDRAQFDAVCDVNYLHYGGHGYIHAMEGGQGTELLRHAKAAGVTTTFDLIGPSENTVAEITDLLSSVDYFMPSMEEAVFMSGRTEPADCASFFLDLGVGCCILKWGANGSFVKGQNVEFHVPAFEVDVADTTGCGDSYCGGFIAGLSLGYDLEEACRLGTASSALVATGLGSDAGVIDLDTTLAFMHHASTLSP